MSSEAQVGPRETWATRVGLILAMAGNAIGLGNFLRFPGRVALYGGGAYLLPYFLALLLLGFPIMWLEWAIGRHGGQYRAHWLAPMMYLIARKRFSRSTAMVLAAIAGGLTLAVGIILTAYYTNILGWVAFWAGMSLSGKITEVTTVDAAVQYLVKVISDPVYNLTPWVITLILAFVMVAPGIRRGIERAALVMMPLLFIFAVGLLITSLTWRTPVKPEWDSLKGFVWMWTPRTEKLADPAAWLEGAGQIFFTLSLGIAGIIPSYASYLRRDEDIALGALMTASLNEFAEVICGGTIAFSLGYAFGGPDPIIAVYIKGKSPFSLAITSYPAFFGSLGTAGALLGSIWYLLLWFAGITSAIALINAVAEMFTDIGLSRSAGTGIAVLLLFIFGLPIVVEGSMTAKYDWGPTTVYLDFADFLNGSFLLVVTALFEVIVAGYFLWPEGYEEVNRGGLIKVPLWLWKYVLSVIAPIFLIAMLMWVPFSARPGQIMTKTEAPLQWLGPLLASLVMLFTVVLFAVGALVAYKAVKKRFPE